MDTFGDFSWIFFVHENSSPWVNFGGHFLGEFYWTLFDGDKNIANTVGQSMQGVWGRSPC